MENMHSQTESEEWWHEKADELYFVDEYDNQDTFKQGIGSLLAKSRERAITEAIEALQKELKHWDTHPAQKNILIEALTDLLEK